MKFDHMVKFNGVYYPTGAEVPVGNEPIVKPKEEKVAVELPKTTISKDDIEGMNNVMKLRKVAKENRINVPNDANMKELKEIIINGLGL